MDSGMRLDIGSSEQHQRSAGGRMTRCAARGTKHSDRPADLCACIPTGSGELVPVDGLCHSCLYKCAAHSLGSRLERTTQYA